MSQPPVPDVPRPWPQMGIRDLMPCACRSHRVPKYLSCRYRIAGCWSRRTAIIDWQLAQMRPIEGAAPSPPPQPLRLYPTFEERNQMPCSCSTASSRSACMAKPRCELMRKAVEQWCRKQAQGQQAEPSRQGVLFDGGKP